MGVLFLFLSIVKRVQTFIRGKGVFQASSAYFRDGGGSIVTGSG